MVDTTRLMVHCPLCHSENTPRTEGLVRDLPEIPVLKCSDCSLVFLGSFDHIHDEFYEESKMRVDDINMDTWISETKGDDERRFRYLHNFLRNADVLDFGAGNGGFLRLAKQDARSVTAVELDREASLLFERNNIPHHRFLKDIPANKRFNLITAFHVIEHLKNPIDFLKEASSLLHPDGSLYLEFPNADDALLSLYGSKPFSEFTYWSCHLMLFNHETIKVAIKKAGLQCKNIKQIQRYPLSNHLYWLAKGLPGGHDAWPFLDSQKLNIEYEKILANAKVCDTLLVEVSL